MGKIILLLNFPLQTSVANYKLNLRQGQSKHLIFPVIVKSRGQGCQTLGYVLINQWNGILFGSFKTGKAMKV